MKTLSTDQIQTLHTFVKKHYVEYYDIELELVDHLANGIEAQWVEDSTITFEIALEREFKKFGIFGFSDVVDNKIGLATNSYLKQMYRVLLSFFTIPKIVISLAIFLVCFAIGVTLPELALPLFVSTIILCLLSFIVIGLKWRFELKKLNKESQKKWYLTKVATMALGGPPLLLIAPLFNIISGISKRLEPIAGVLFLSCILTLLLLWTYISLFMFIPFMRKEILNSIQRHQLT